MTRQPHRIVLAIRALDAGGSERQLTEIAKNLDRSQFDPRVVCLRAEGICVPELERAGVPVIPLSILSLRSPHTPLALLQFARYLREHQIELMHTFDPPSNYILGPVARIAGTRVVLSSQRSLRSLRSPVRRQLLRFTDRIVNGIVVNAEAVQQELIHSERVPAYKIHLCRNGIDIGRFQSAPREPNPETPVIIGTVCVIRKEKDLETLLTAFSRLRQRGVPARLRVVGSGPHEPELRRFAAQLHLGSDCEFRPATSQVPDELRDIDIFVLSSLSEALSNALMEAMSSGCCAVATRVGGNPELVRNEDTGLLFSPGDAGELETALSRVIANPDFRLSLAGRGSRFISSHFTLAAAARQMQSIYYYHLRGL